MISDGDISPPPLKKQVELIPKKRGRPRGSKNGTGRRYKKAALKRQRVEEAVVREIGQKTDDSKQQNLEEMKPKADQDIVEQREEERQSTEKESTANIGQYKVAEARRAPQYFFHPALQQNIGESFGVIGLKSFPIMLLALCQNCLNDANCYSRLYTPGGKQCLSVTLCQTCVGRNRMLTKILKCGDTSG